MHIAWAYNNPSLTDQSRAALFARAFTIGGAAATLCATLPLLVARMETRPRVGALVTLASLAFALVAFVALMMVAGPLHARQRRHLRAAARRQRRGRATTRRRSGGGAATPVAAAGAGGRSTSTWASPGVHGGGTEMHGLDRLDAPRRGGWSWCMGAVPTARGPGPRWRRRRL